MKMKPGQECLFRYLLQVNILLVIIIDKNLGGNDALVYILCQFQV